MAIHNNRKAPVKQSTQSVRFPAPSKGMDGRIGFASDDMDACIYTYNLMASQYGMKVREGYREQCINLQDTITSQGVRTLVPFEAIGDPTKDRLFAVTNEGIWNVTDENAPVFMLAFTLDTTSLEAGVGVFSHYIDSAGKNLLYYADGANGLFVYDSTTEAWNVPTIDSEPTGLDATKIRFVTVHKQRIWFVERDSTTGWYLNILAVSGKAKPFNFGAQFKHGGKLVGLYNWSVDGGIGVDDYMVAISGAGDVLPYSGGDPALPDWSLRGVYFVGVVANSKRCASEFGGDLHILSSYGLTSMADLLRGVNPSDRSGKSGIGARMAYSLQNDMRDYRIDSGWGINFAPSTGSLIINTPKRTNGVFIQYVYDLDNDTFGWWRDVPMSCMSEYEGKVYVGTLDNRVLVMDTDLDEVLITPDPTQTVNGRDIKFSTLFSFNAYEAGGRFKRGVMIRPDFLSPVKLSYSAKFTYDYELLQLTDTYSETVRLAGRWDSSRWDDAIWGSVNLANQARVIGGGDYGRTMAVAVSGSGDSSVWLMSYDVMYNVGGIL